MEKILENWPMWRAWDFDQTAWPIWHFMKSGQAGADFSELKTTRFVQKFLSSRRAYYKACLT